MTDVCFWCNRKKGGDDGDPVYNDYNFCNNCLVEVRKGITIIQITEKPNGNPPIADDLYPTGKWIVVDADNVKEVLDGSPVLGRVLVTRKMYVNENDWESMGLP